jgi:hypothetical protein
MPRLDTRLESEGAEFLVLGALLLERIPSYKSYTNMKGYDLIATSPEHGTSARIQVKSRWGTGTSSFPIKSFDCDFVVFARLNRGNKAQTAAVRDPEFFVFPIRLLRSLPRTTGWGKIAVTGVKDWQNYKSRWDLIRKFLASKPKRPRAARR